ALVLAPPGLLLVLRPRDEPRRAVHGNCEMRRLAGLGGDEDELPAHILACIIAFRGAGADVDQLRLGASADAVLGKGDRLVGPGGDALAVDPAAAFLLLLPQLG